MCLALKKAQEKDGYVFGIYDPYLLSFVSSKIPCVPRLFSLKNHRKAIEENDGPVRSALMPHFLVPNDSTAPDTGSHTVIRSRDRVCDDCSQS